jgi:hypothetical protein
MTTTHSCPRTVSPGAAILAARLALESLCEFSLENNPSSVLPIAKDRKPAGGKVESGQLHLVAFAGLNEAVAGIGEWLAAAGLELQGVVTSEALHAGEAIRRALECKSVPGRTLVNVDLSHDGAVLTATHDGQLALVRPINIGLDALIEALVRPIRPAGDSQQSLTLTREQAEQLLHRAGIPTAESEIDRERGIRGSAVLPVLQPVIQRIAIEIKQSLRFGLSETDRAGVWLGVSGAGADVPRLRTVLAGQVGVTHEETGEVGAGQENEIAVLALSSAVARQSLSSMEQQERTNRLRLRYAAIAGAVLAAASIGLDTFTERAALRSARSELEVLTSAAKERERTAAVEQTAIRARVSLDELDGRIVKALGERGDWASFLSFLPKAMPEKARLVGIDALTERDRPVLQLRGQLAGGDDRATSQEIASFIERLSACPLVDGVLLQSTIRSHSEAGDTQSFELLVRLVPTPSPSLTARHDATTKRPLAAAERGEAP